MNTQINKIFSKIAKKYDFINFVLSFGLNFYWQKSFINLLKINKNKYLIADLCCGTGAIAKAIFSKNKECSIVLVDFCSSMLSIAKKSLKQYKNQTTFLHENVCNTSINNNSLDYIAIAYGIRNITNKEELLQHILPLLKENGTLGILELTTPNNKFIRYLHYCYTKIIGPIIGLIFTGSPKAYNYLHKSIQEFYIKDIILLLKKYGFEIRHEKRLSFGIAFIVIAKKMKGKNIKPDSVNLIKN